MWAAVAGEAIQQSATEHINSPSVSGCESHVDLRQGGGLGDAAVREKAASLSKECRRKKQQNRQERSSGNKRRQSGTPDVCEGWGSGVYDKCGGGWLALVAHAINTIH